MKVHPIDLHFDQDQKKEQYRFSYKDFGKAPYQNYPQAYISTLRTNFDMGTQSKIFITKSVEPSETT